MSGYIYLGARVILDKDMCMVISELDESGYFEVEHEEFLIIKRINLTEIELNGYSFTGIPMVKYTRMDYDLGL